jgi:hypothetical protein
MITEQDFVAWTTTEQQSIGPSNPGRCVRVTGFTIEHMRIICKLLRQHYPELMEHLTDADPISITMSNTTFNMINEQHPEIFNFQDATQIN